MSKPSLFNDGTRLSVICDRDETIIGIAVDYATWVEYGTSKTNVPIFAAEYGTVVRLSTLMYKKVLQVVYNGVRIWKKKLAGT